MTVPHGCMLHHFHGGRWSPSQGSITADTFHALIDHVQPRDAREWLADPHGAVLTLDDGLLCQWDVALPVLRERGLTAIWHVNTGPTTLEYFRTYRHSFPSMEAFYEAFTELAVSSKRWDPRPCPADYLADRAFYTQADREFRFLRDEVLGEEGYMLVMLEMTETARFSPGPLLMTADHWRALHDEGHVVGMHTHTHPTAPMDRERSHEEWRQCAFALSDAGIRARTAAYPCGKSSAFDRGVLLSHEIERAFLATPDSPDPSDPLLTPRMDHAVVVKEMGL